MCGICGFVQQCPDLEAAALEARLEVMNATLVHRGPDDGGTWVERAGGVGLGHQRLAILDLSAAGHQPMVSPSGRFVIAYNGEVYNFRELGRELQGAGYRFRGHSDTEVLLAAIEHWGVAASLPRLNGMFAFALWDREQRSLTLARDRAGKKPLYYGRCGGSLLFGSELKALRAHPEFDAGIDRDALGLMVRYTWLPGPRSIYQGIHKLPAGTFVHITSDQAGPGAPVPYWSAREVSERGGREPFPGSFDQAVEHLNHLLADAVAQRMVADVDLGALLSGGVDSTTIVALMQARSERPVRTFSIGFKEGRYNEAEHAKATAAYLGTEHTELYVTPQDSLDLIPRLPTLYDEPFADPSQLPTHLVTQLARAHVTVALSGDGGDELFGGYSRYYRALQEWQRWRRVPAPVQRLLAGGAHLAAAQGWRWLGERAVMAGHTPAKWRRAPVKWEKRYGGLPVTDPVRAFVAMRQRCADPSEFVVGATAAPDLLRDPGQWPDPGDPLQTMMALDFAGYLADDTLVKVDRASMGVGLELRSPLLDVRVIEFARSLPRPMLVDEKGGKRILRQVLARHVPPGLTDRPKWGFGVPIGAWLRGPLRDWAEALLDPVRLRREGNLHPEAVHRVWRQHLAGWRERPELLWALLMFQAWNAEQF